MLPLVIGIPGTILSAIQFVVELRSKGDKEFTPADRKAELRMFVWFLFFVIGIILFGFPYAGPLMVTIYLHFHGMRNGMLRWARPSSPGRCFTACSSTFWACRCSRAWWCNILAARGANASPHANKTMEL